MVMADVFCFFENPVIDEERKNYINGTIGNIATK